MENDETKKALYDAATADFPQLLSCVPDEFKTREMCNDAAAKDSKMLEYVPDEFKTHEEPEGSEGSEESEDDRVRSRQEKTIEEIDKGFEERTNRLIEMNKGPPLTKILKDYFCNKEFLLEEVKTIALMYGTYTLARVVGGVILVYGIREMMRRGGM